MTNLIGLPLETVRALLTDRDVSNHKIVILETTPPRAEKATGPWRVLRCQMLENEHWELLVARQQMSETRRSTEPF
jgi:hypothetical protein